MANIKSERCTLFAPVLFLIICSSAVAYDPFDPNGSINIKWDILSWTSDGYAAAVKISNNQMYRHITSPGWKLGWRWAKKEVIWSMVGAKVTDQGDCSKFKGNIPLCCEKTPVAIDLLPGVAYNQQFTNFCKGGVLTSLGQDPTSAVSAFQINVGFAGTSNRTVRLPEKFSLLGPGLGYTCSAARIVPASVSLSSDGRSKTRAMMTWSVTSLTCTYSQVIASKNPTCCVSMSSFYSPLITSCPLCACGCEDANKCMNDIKDASMLQEKTSAKENAAKLLQCTDHKCVIRVHWHVKANYRKYWRVRITITNFNFLMNHTQWTLVAQHPNLNKLANISSFLYKPLTQYNPTNDTGMFYGIKTMTDVIREAGPKGYIYTELIMKKDKNTFTLDKGWIFPMRLYFNGDECMMPLPDLYPHLPNSSHTIFPSSHSLATLLILVLLVFMYA